MSETKVTKRRKKVNKACVFCRRSHMVCDEQRPCSRCVKRSIGHLCRDEDSDVAGAGSISGAGTGDSDTNLPNEGGNAETEVDSARVSISAPHQLTEHTQEDQQRHTIQQARQNQHQLDIQPIPAHLAQVMTGHHVDHAAAHATHENGAVVPDVVIDPAHNMVSTINATIGSSAHANTASNVHHALSGTSLGRISSINQPLFLSEHIGSEFSSLNEFLTMLEDPMLIEPGTPIHHMNIQAATESAVSAERTQGRPQQQPITHESNEHANNGNSSQPPELTQMRQSVQSYVQGAAALSPALLPDDQQPTPKENFFLTAADPSTEINPEDRLKLVINAKLEAGLLQPYNYAKGYSRLQNFMDKYMNQSSKQRILKPLSIIRPAFRAIARSLKDVDLVLVEESFERMLLSYDRVFTSMSMPACLWRRTGEIYRGNKEFASLVDCKVDELRDGKLAIYELMSEESAVNFWEKYGSIAFDKGQKAVLTSCNLRTRDGRQRRPCCFSFTIRRDRYNIPICIVGNFIPIS
ncbi:unnamed protein product [Kluyveromyces dobzhanskii CBS 2104]|uniref:WGS project CCBQ000000000 data, contig 00104 n=1 Tax=Kluyveromyces dobzhanskii CBS 2104 TaxID=1427455 RepID=A0A0A8L3F9_9SACH|nr:unnamed protein product [Kluyveromyces dobzhanskii CBS 2104]